MSLDDALRGRDGGSGHHGEQRHGKDGSRHPSWNVCHCHFQSEFSWMRVIHMALPGCFKNLKSCAKVHKKLDIPIRKNARTTHLIYNFTTPTPTNTWTDQQKMAIQKRPLWTTYFFIISSAIRFTLSISSLVNSTSSTPSNSKRKPM